MFERTRTSTLWEAAAVESAKFDPVGSVESHQLCKHWGITIEQLGVLSEFVGECGHKKLPLWHLGLCEFRMLLTRCGAPLSCADLVKQMFNTRARSTHGPQPLISFSSIASILCCVAGVGSPSRQAEECVQILGQSTKTDSISRANLLQLIMMSIPCTMQPEKKKLFSMVGYLFDELGAKCGTLTKAQLSAGLDKRLDLAALWRAIWPLPLWVPGYDWLNGSIYNLLRHVNPSCKADIETKHDAERRNRWVCSKLEQSTLHWPLRTVELELLFKGQSKSHCQCRASRTQPGVFCWLHLLLDHSERPWKELNMPSTDWITNDLSIQPEDKEDEEASLV